MQFIKAILGVNVKKLFVYKADFVFNFLSVLIWVGAGLVNIKLLYRNFENIAGWNLEEVSLLYGTWSLTFAIYNAFGSGILELGELVYTGKLDGILVKPKSPFLQIVMSRINTMGIGFLVYGITLVCVSLNRLSLKLSLGEILYLGLAIGSGGVLIFSINSIFAMICFWTTKAGSAIQISYDLHKMIQYPIEIYGNEIGLFLSIIVPLAFSNYFPVSYILGKSSLFLGILSILVDYCALGSTVFIWRKGVSVYESVGA